VVRAGEADSRRGSAPTASDLELGAFHIKLGPGVGTRSMKRDHFVPQEILPGRDTTRNRVRHFPFVGNHSVDAPGLVGGVQAVFVNLEPVQASHGGLEGVGDLCEVGNYGPMVAGVNGVSRIRRIQTSQGMMPLRRHLRACRDNDGDIRQRRLIRVDAAVADQVIGSNVRDWAIVTRHADAVYVTLVDSVNVEFLEDGMC